MSEPQTITKSSRTRDKSKKTSSAATTTSTSLLNLILICIVILSIIWFGFSIRIQNSVLVQELITSPFLNHYNVSTRTTTTTTPRITIAYAVSITSCDNPTSVVDGAAVLKHSIHINSIRGGGRSATTLTTTNNDNNNNNTSLTSRYDYHMYAFVHPIANDKCSSLLRDIGYDVYVKDTPFNISNIRNKKYQNWITGASCCGEKEFLKLYAYTLTQYQLVVHLDTDVLLLKPFDDIYDVMLANPNSRIWKNAKQRLPIMYNKSLPTNNEYTAMYTKDYNMAIPPVDPKFVVVQGGFYVVRPNITVFNEMIDIILEGNYEPSNGWGSLGYGKCYGAAQIQGLYAYYFGEKHPNTSVELNRCYYNNMVDSPTSTIKGTKAYGKIMSGEKHPPLDCRTIPIDQIYSTHFTLCQKPWTCSDNVPTLCKDLLRSWFRVRYLLETQWINDGLITFNSNITSNSSSSSSSSSSSDNNNVIPRLHSGKTINPNDFHMGYCRGKSYIPMKMISS